MKFMKLGSKPDLFQRDGDDVRYVACELATDIIIAVKNTKFYLHKFPLLSKSALLQNLVATAHEQNNSEIQIPDIPGGPAAFEMCAKFCYGMVVTLNCHNVMAARCAAEYLQMHDTLEKGNLIYKIEVFLNYSIFCSWKDSIVVLQSCKLFLPWTEDLKVISRCVDSVASKACTDTSDVEWSYTYNRKKIPSENGMGSPFNAMSKQHLVPKDWWVEDLCDLDIDHYRWVIMAIKSKGGMPPEVIGESLKAYTYRKIPGFVMGNICRSGDVTVYSYLVETIIWLLPLEIGSLSCTFLLKLLKASTLYNCSERVKKELVKRIGPQLDQASIQDLLIPSPSGECIYDIDVVLNMVEEFMQIEDGVDHFNSHARDEVLDDRRQDFLSDASKNIVAKLIDAYLAEVAKDPNSSIPKFIDLAGTIPATARPIHDSLYRAIDICLKAHPDLSKVDKKNLCATMDCKKLSSDASMHAIQNERLPMRVVIQVLFFEQMRASAGAEGIDDPAVCHSLLPREKGNSRGSSMSAATTTTEDGSEGILTADDLKSLTAMRLLGGSQRSNGSSDAHRHDNEKGHINKVKGIFTPKRILSRLWSSRTYGGESSSSDASEAPSSVNMEDSKSTNSRGSRYMVS